jgi:hypothetical protein
MNDDQTNITSNNETHTDISISNVDPNENNLINQPIQRKEIVLDKEIIFDCLKLYKSLEEKYTSKKENLDNLNEEEKDKILMESEIFFIQLKNIEKIDNLDKYVNLKELYLMKNYITEIRGLDNLINLEVLNLSSNLIEKIENLQKLKSLAILDITNNNIQNFDIKEIPKTIVLFYCYYNPFFDKFEKIDYFKYRSQLIINCEKIERIDKLDIKDRERFLLIEESNLKSKNQFSLKSLEYIYNYYLSLKKVSEEEKKKEEEKNEEEKNEEDDEEEEEEKNDNKEEKRNNSNKEKLNIDTKSTLNHIHELEKKSNEFLKNSLLKLVETSDVYVKRNKENKKKFIESDSVKELKKQIDILNKKFKEKNFLDPKIKEAFQKKINDAINFQQRITNAENLAKDVIERLNDTSKSKVLSKNLDVIQEDKNEFKESIKYEKVEKPKKKIEDKKFEEINEMKELKQIEEEINKDVKDILKKEEKEILQKEEKEILQKEEKDLLQKEEKEISTNKKIKNKNEKLNNNPLLSDSDLEDD